MTAGKRAPQSELAATFSARLKRARKAHGWSQAEFARRAELTQTQVSRIEAGRAIPKIPILLKLATSLHLSTGYLLGLCDDPKWLSFEDRDVLHRVVDAVPPGDRALVHDILRAFVQRKSR